MPWKETCSMNERLKFIAAFLAGDDTVAGLAQQFGVSRKTAHKWVARYKQGGVAALEERSRAPKTHPRRVPSAVIEAIVELRRQHRKWGPVTLRELLRQRHPRIRLPAASTIGLLLKKRGLVRRRRVRRNRPRHEGPLTRFSRPNAVWCIDFKGYLVIAGERFHPLTVTDGYSRFLLAAQGFARQDADDVKQTLKRLFRAHGLPSVIRSDNGAPFSSSAPAGLSYLSVWWARLGIRHERIDAGHPEQNGAHERMHLTLKEAAADPPRASFREQQRALDEFRDEFNNVRPHQAIGLKTPSQLYEPSSRTYPASSPQLVYPEHFETACVCVNGTIRFERIQWYLSSVLGNQLIGLESCKDDRWKVWFGSTPLGVLDVNAARRRNQQPKLIRYDGKRQGRG
jgi:transposase InsO family protein